ncbi:ABC transporter permease [Dongia rigui]|uniref:ABC transporter permease n=1 Tax=Dongia rigui TaxID=940149 RepID=A0ABU5E4L9_9PROT|nr:ABC transporter permease [Dongia rigui]MDY0874513.1 ABC transporter permease [Dongia rigui]
MAGYLIRRIFQALLTLIGISIITFVILYALPADPARQVAGRTASVAQVEQVRHQLGLDRPIWAQYGIYLGKLATGDLGRSYVQRTQVSELIASRLPATLWLMLAAIGFELLIGLSIGTYAAFRRNSAMDQVVMLGAFVFVSAPQFLLGYTMLYVFAVWLGWFPIGGYGSLKQIVLPALTLGLLGGGWYARMMRSSVIEVLRQDYVRTARAKGLGKSRIIFRHIVPNAVLPIIAMIGIDIGAFMSGIVIVESVFGWPGIGQLTWQAIQQIDIPIIMGVTLVSACAIVLGNLLADLAAPLIDPRIRLK